MIIGTILILAALLQTPPGKLIEMGKFDLDGDGKKEELYFTSHLSSPFDINNPQADQAFDVELFAKHNGEIVGLGIIKGVQSIAWSMLSTRLVSHSDHRILLIEGRISRAPGRVFYGCAEEMRIFQIPYEIFLPLTKQILP